MFGLTNEIREARGHAHLSRDSTLSRIACWHNQDMLVHGYAAHEDAEGRTPSDRTGREHRRLIGTTGENVFAANGASAQEETRSSENRAQTIVEEWMGSPGHRANILRSKFTHLGACITQTRSQTRATQVFAAVWAYLDRPLPWSVSPRDSLSTAIIPVKASAPPAEYAFVPVGEPLPRAFQKETRGRPFEGTIQFPSAPGRYGTRFLFPTEGTGRYTVLPGPRVLVD